MLKHYGMTLFMLLAGYVTCNAQGINWTSDLAAARKAAAEQRRLILLHFYSDDCPPCERLEKSVFPVPEVAEACNRNYIPVKVYVKQSQALCKQYQINRWPTDVIITPNGQEVFRTISPGNPRDYSLMLSGIAMQAGVGAGRSEGGYQPNTTSPYASPTDALAQTHAVAQQQAQLVGNNLQTQLNQQAVQVTDQLQQRANQFQQQAEDVQQQTERRVSQFQEQAEQAQTQLQNQATQLQQNAQQRVNAGVDYIAQATTLPSMLPPRPTFGGNQIATSAPQPGRITEGTQDVPRPETMRANGGPFAGAPVYAPPTIPVGQEPSNPAAGATPPANATAAAPQPQEYVRPAPRPYQQPWQHPQGMPVPPAGPQYQTNPYFTRNAPANPATNTPAAPAAEQPLASNPAPAVAPQNPAVAANAPLAPAAPAAIPPSPNLPLASAPVVNAPPAPPPTALDGYCPVTLLETKKWKKADPQWGAIHRGRTYLFASADAQQKFLSDPDRFAPILAGNDPVRFSDKGELVGGIRKHGIMYRNQIFLFTDEASLTKFTQAPDRYSSAAYQAMAAADPTLRR